MEKSESMTEDGQRKWRLTLLVNNKDTNRDERNERKMKEQEVVEGESRKSDERDR